MQKQRADACIWAVVDPAEPVEERRFVIIGTGQVFPSMTDLEYIGTWQTDGGAVWHLFEDCGTNFGSITQSAMRRSNERGSTQ